MLSDTGIILLFIIVHSVRERTVLGPTDLDQFFLSQNVLLLFFTVRNWWLMLKTSLLLNLLIFKILGIPAICMYHLLKCKFSSNHYRFKTK